jgi:hypothetical protein
MALLAGTGRKEEPQLTQTDRERYGIACAYIQRRLEELGVLRARADELNGGILGAVKNCVQVMRHVDERNAQYTKLNSAISRFQRLTQSLESLGRETTTAWNKLHEAEQKLVDHPAYSSLKPEAELPPPDDS